MEWKRNKERNESIRQLRVDGFSISHIARTLGVGKSMVSYHCMAVRPETVNLKRKAPCTTAANKKHSENWKERKRLVRLEAEKQWKSVREKPSFMGFLGLYWGEGNKRASGIGIVNNDPGIIMASLSVFRELCPEATFDIAVRVYPDHDKARAKFFWSKIVGQDVKILEKRWAGKLHRAHSRRGLCTVRFSDWPTKIRILTWIDLWRSEVVRAEGIEPTEYRVPNAAPDRWGSP